MGDIEDASLKAIQDSLGEYVLRSKRRQKALESFDLGSKRCKASKTYISWGKKWCSGGSSAVELQSIAADVVADHGVNAHPAIVEMSKKGAGYLNKITYDTP